MKITVFFTFDMSLKEWKNVGIFSREVRPYLEYIKRGHQIQFITYGDGEDLMYGNELSGIEITPIYKYMGKSNSRLINLFKSIIFLFAYGELLRSSNVFKTNQMFGSWLAIIAGKIYRKPVLARIGYDLHEFYSKRKTSTLKKIQLRLMSEFTYRFSNHILITSSSGVDYIKKTFKVKDHKISCHPNFIDTDIFQDQSTKREMSILYVGRFNDHKNLFPVIDASLISGISLNFVGWGEEEEKLRKYVDEQNAPVFFLGKLPNEELSAIYNKHDFFILNSFSEGNPKVLLEAMSCGCVCVGNNVEGINNIIDHKRNGMLTDGTSEKIVENLKLLSNDQILMRSISQNAIRYVKENCSITSLIDFELEIFNRILS